MCSHSSTNASYNRGTIKNHCQLFLPKKHNLLNCFRVAPSFVYYDITDNLRVPLMVILLCAIPLLILISNQKKTGQKCSVWSSSKIVNFCRTESCRTKIWDKILSKVDWCHQMYSKYVVWQCATSRNVALLSTNQKFLLVGGVGGFTVSLVFSYIPRWTICQYSALPRWSVSKCIEVW